MFDAQWRTVNRRSLPRHLSGGIARNAGQFAFAGNRLLALALGARDQRLGQRPFVVGQVARVAQLAAIITGAVSGRPHAKVPASWRGGR